MNYEMTTNPYQSNYHSQGHHDGKSHLPETQKLLHRRQQRVMPHFSHRTAHAIHKCHIARMSELRDQSLKAELAELVGMGVNSRSAFQIMDFEKKVEIFVTEETSTCMDRNLCPGSLRAYKANIYELDDESGRSETIAVLSKKCGTGGVSVLDGRSRTPIGHIKHNFHCTTLELEIQDSNNETLYRMKANRHAAALIFGKWPCGACSSVPFYVENAFGEPHASIANEWGGCVREFCTDSDDYFIDFGIINDITDRLLLVAGTMYVDIRYFSSCGADCTLRGCLMSRFSPVSKFQPLVKYGKYGLAGLKVAQHVGSGIAGKPSKSNAEGPYSNTYY